MVFLKRKLELHVSNTGGEYTSAASKAGIIGFSKSVAKEVGSRSIRCNTVTPGFIATEMTGELSEDVQKSYMDNIPLKDFGTVDDIAAMCVFLGSDKSRYVTGQVISVCGGDEYVI